MNNRRESFDLPTNDPNKVIEVKVRYSKSDMVGGEKQGYWLNITSVEIDGIFRITTAYTGLKRFMEPAKRFGAKKLATLMSGVKHEILGPVETPLVRLAQRVAEDSELVITWSSEKVNA